MIDKYNILLRRIDYTNQKLLVFLLPRSDKLVSKFRITEGDTEYWLHSGLTEDNSYTDIEFKAGLEVNLDLFEVDGPPIYKIGRSTIKSAERVEFENLKTAEQKKVEEQIKVLFPSVLKAFNRFRRACRIALFRESVAGRISTHQIRDGQLHQGKKVDHELEKLFASDDTDVLFGAFADISPIVFLGDADIQYTITDQSEKILKGVFKNGYHGLHSTNRWLERQEQIQSLIDNHWSIEDDVILASLEFLCSGNYRMAIFNAATVLELKVIEFWEEKRKQLAGGSRQDQEKMELLERKISKSKYQTNLEKILRIVFPEFAEQSLIDNGTLDRCVQAWVSRNEMSHLYKLTKEGGQHDVDTDKAWSAVSSIVALLDWFYKQ